AYVAVGAAWAATGAIWAPLLVAAAFVVLAIAIELGFGAKATGLVAGMLPTAVVTAGLLATLTLVLARLSSQQRRVRRRRPSRQVRSTWRHDHRVFFHDRRG